MKILSILLFSIIIIHSSCSKQDDKEPSDILGYQLLEEITGHWVGSNVTAFGNFDWFAFDFRPISASHVHSIYEGATQQNIITSIFIAEFEGKKQIMARNGGWLGNQYRATYFVLDQAEESDDVKFYRLVDAVGKEKRAYIELKFENDTMYFDAYKDDSGSLDQPYHHMGFKGTNYNPTFAESAVQQFNFPQEIAEIDLENKFVNLIDPDSALFLNEDEDPFPKSMHGHLSDLNITFEKDSQIENEPLLLYFSTAPIINENGQVDFDNLDKKVVRTITIQPEESFYGATYLHPDTYYVTAFSDLDNNFFPSQGDIGNISKEILITPEDIFSINLNVEKSIQ